jgi:hypothetical protein
LASTRVEALVLVLEKFLLSPDKEEESKRVKSF